MIGKKTHNFMHHTEVTNTASEKQTIQLHDGEWVREGRETRGRGG